MDAIRKKMQSLKGETDGLYATIARFEESTKDYQRMADQVSVCVCVRKRESEREWECMCEGD